MFKVGLTILILLAPTSNAMGVESLRKTLTTHEIQTQEPVSLPSGLPHLWIVVDNQGQAVINTSVLARLIQLKLEKKGFRSSLYDGSFRANFSDKKLEPHILLAPKIVVDIELLPHVQTGELILRAGLSLVQYENINEHGTAFRAKLSWSKDYTISALTIREVEAKLARSLSGDLNSLIATFPAEKAKSFKRPGIVLRNSPRATPITNTLAYDLAWRDKESLSNLFGVGITGGVPNLVNLRLEYWGSVSFPLTLGLSGSYLASDKRGLGVEVAWVFDRLKSLKQAIGITLAKVNETREKSTPVLDATGFQTGTKKTTIDQLMNFLGPTYIVQWKGFRFQSGLLFALNSNVETSFKALVQVGYVHLLTF